ncbi:hypothetical protein [Aurantiacibacter hainanensis]|uniref:hypothetical protein n=1 Tax=Aurantiacibacter hainanensis TaxID=3076114 RepID=UPI0030C6CDD6
MTEIGKRRWTMAELCIPPASVSAADVPIVDQQVRLDSRRSERALLSSMALGA